MAHISLPQQNPNVRRTLPEHFRTKDHRTDTAGIPWEGRDYAASPFPNDRGEREEHVAQALTRFDAGEDPHREGIVAALSTSRVLIPIQAIATDVATTESGLHADNASDMAMVKLQLPSGDVALPLFTSVEALRLWNPEARPVPMVCAQAAQSAVAEGCTSLVIDLGREQPLVISRGALWALGQGRTWNAPYRDVAVLEEVAHLRDEIDEIRDIDLLPSESREVELRLTLVRGLDREELSTVLARVQAFLAHSEIVAERVSSLKLSVR